MAGHIPFSDWVNFVAFINDQFDELDKVFALIERAANLSAQLDKLSKTERLYATMLQRRLRLVVRDLCKQALEIVKQISHV